MKRPGKNTTSVPLTLTRKRLSELVTRVRQGEEFVITRHGIEIARLIPAQSRPKVSEAIGRLRASRPKRRATVAEITKWKNHGRP